MGPCPWQFATYWEFQEFNQRPPNHRCSISPLECWPSLTNECSGMSRNSTRDLPITRCSISPLECWPSLTNECSGTGLIFWSDTFPPRNPHPTFSVLRHAAACCRMLQDPHQQAPKTGAAACFNRWCLSAELMLSAENKSQSSFWANSGFPHLTNTQQTQESGR